MRPGEFLGRSGACLPKQAIGPELALTDRLAAGDLGVQPGGSLGQSGTTLQVQAMGRGGALSDRRAVNCLAKRSGELTVPDSPITASGPREAHKTLEVSLHQCRDGAAQHWLQKGHCQLGSSAMQGVGQNDT